MNFDETIKRSQEGDSDASERLFLILYDELRALARQQMAREMPGQTIGATALVHEAYLKLIGPEVGEATPWSHRGHFFQAAAQTMRRILVDRAREKKAVKRGGNWRKLGLEAVNLTLHDVPAEVVDVDAALSALQEKHPEKADLVEMRFFGGLTGEQAAAALSISPATADRYWTFARAWLFRHLEAS